MTRLCAFDGCMTQPVARLLGESYACNQHASMLLNGDTRALIAESARMLGALRADGRPVEEQLRAGTGRQLELWEA